MSTLDSWLQAFYRGEHAVMESVYRQHYADVSAGAARAVRGVDRETVAQEVFCLLLENERFRRGFQGGELGAWLHRLGANHAVNYLRKHHRESSVAEADLEGLLDRPAPDFGEQLEARDFLQRFAAEALPPKWRPVFEACFVEGLDQRSAAVRLGMARTTLAYQWLRVKWLLEAFARERGA